MIPLDIQKLNLDSLPSVELSDRHLLPASPAIYFAIDGQGVIQYIGRSINPQLRWKDHHKYQQISAVGSIKISYLLVDSPELLPKIEAALIEFFRPRLNRECRESQSNLTRASITIPEDLLEEFKRYCEDQKRSVSAQLAFMIQETLKGRSQCWQSMTVNLKS